MLLAIEGCDCLGKATQASLLKTYLESAGEKPKLIAFPRDDGPVGKLIRAFLDQTFVIEDRSSSRHLSKQELPHAEIQVIQALMLSDRLAAIDILNNPDGVTICDRYSMSGIVYGLADGLDEPWLYDMHRSLPQAKIQILLDGDPEEAAKRRPVLRDRYEKDFRKLHKIREIYHSIWTDHKMRDVDHWNWIVVDAMQPQEKVHSDIIAAYKQATALNKYTYGR